MKKLLLLGDQAVALGAIRSGISGVYAYPGTPSTEITEYIQASPEAAGIHSRWCTNEKTAMEAALGISYVGRRALVCMKHVGLNVAADAFLNSAMTGTNGGLIVLVADDPSMHSSQNEQDSRFYGKFAFVPTLEPASQQEAYDMMAYGFDLSEKQGLPVLMRITTRMAHSRAVVQTGPRREVAPISFPKEPSRWVLLPVNARKRYDILLGQQPELEKISEDSPYNKYVEGKDRSLGVIACGIGHNYLMEQYPEGCPYPVLKIAQYPLPRKHLEKMAADCRKLLILEDGQPFVEEQMRGIFGAPCAVAGRLSGELPRAGELTPDNVRSALGLPAAEGFAASSLVMPRPPVLCAGCGHRDVYDVLNGVAVGYPAARIFSDIGCYTLGALPPFRAIHSCVDMGASITMAKGAADAGLFPAVAVIGDSTFTHSGITGLLDAVNSQAPITVVISDNLTTAMTGGQDSAGTGRLEAICRGVGVEEAHIRVVIPISGNRDEIAKIIRDEIEYKGVSVIIPRRECIQTLKRNVKKQAR
ncbi:MAG: indolepyruvate ferredoxin oxidoreductase [Rikenellaceae bacterium]|jgi:indolepyruvate ferredoxin oxidoreductase alpha subunit|nr:indolepyruvate ferredoxin oxidoreductase [Rikenellaceae bacterium]